MSFLYFLPFAFLCAKFLWLRNLISLGFEFKLIKNRFHWNLMIWEVPEAGRKIFAKNLNSRRIIRSVSLSLFSLLSFVRSPL